MPQTTFVEPADGDAAVASHVTQFVAAIHDLEDFRDGLEPAGGNLNAGSNKVVNVAVPTAASDAATKNYVDTHPQLPSVDQKTALSGSYGTPGGSNPFVTADDLAVDWEAVRWRDDFIGDRDPRWDLSGTGATYTQESEVGGLGILSTGATMNNEAILDLGHPLVAKEHYPLLRVIASIDQTADTFASIALYGDADNLVEFRYDSADSANWKVRCRAAGVETVTDTTVAADTSDHTFTIRMSLSSVTFTLDAGTPIVVSTNVPAEAVGLGPRLHVKALAASDVSLTVDLVDLTALRG